MKAKTLYPRKINECFFDYNLKTKISTILKRKIKEKEIFIFLKSVSEFLSFNKDIIFAFEYSMHCLNGYAKQQVINFCQKVKGGEKISQACRTCKLIPEYGISILKIGENTGNIKNSFDLIFSWISWHLKQKSEFKQAISYPVFMFFVFVGMLSLFANYIIPNIGELINYINCGANSFYFLDIFVMIIKAKILILIFFSSILLFLYHFFYEIFEKICIKIPIIKNVIVFKNTYIIFYLLGSCLENGISLTESINIAIDSTCGIFKKAITRIKNEIIKGKKMHLAIYEENLFPNPVFNLVKTGEDSGNMVSYFKMIEDIFLSKYKDHLKKILQIFPVILLIFTGALIFLFVYAIFLPIYEIKF